MRLIKRLFELGVFLFIISLFMMNKDVALDFHYFGLQQPIKLAFWELVTISVSMGIIVAAVGDFLSQLKWLAERRKLIKTAREHRRVVDELNGRIEELEADNQKLKNELQQQPPSYDSGAAPSFAAPPSQAEEKPVYDYSDELPYKEPLADKRKKEESFTDLVLSKDYSNEALAERPLSTKSQAGEPVDEAGSKDMPFEAKEKKGP